ncbi:MAG: MFS transporter [Pedosphaera sp.]|nr:MFS transporter [Pedosphaera sp.]
MRSLSESWRTTLIVAIGAAINYGDRAAFSSVLPAIGKDLQLSGYAMGLLGSLFLWSYAIGSPLAGSMADRFSRRETVIWSLALWSSVMLGTGFANGVLMLGVLRVGLGLTECSYLPAAIALVGEHHGAATRARGISLILIGISFGVIAGGAFSGLIADFMGWRAVFWILGALGLACAFVFNLRLARPVRTEAAAKRADDPRFPEALAYLIRVPSYLIVLTKVMLVGVASWTFFTWLPFYFHEVFRMSLTSAGFAGTFFSEVAGLLGITAGAWLSDSVAKRNIRRRMLLESLSYLSAAPFLLLFVGQPGLPTAVAALIFFRLFRGLGDANEQSIVCEIIPSCFRSTAIGIMNTCATTAGGVGVLVAGILKEKLGLGAVFAGTSGAIFLAAMALLFGYFAFVAKDISRALTFDRAG